MSTNTITVTDWYTDDSVTYGNDDAGNCLIQIVRPDACSTSRQWYVTDESDTEMAHGEAKNLRAAKKDAKAALVRAINA